MSRICHIIVAGGSGTRFGSQLPKQLCDLDGRPVLMRAVESLLSATPGADAVIAMHPEYMELWYDLCRRHQFESPSLVAGGASRWESVRNALAAVPHDCDVITVHDGARPVVPAGVILSVVEAVENGAPGAVPVTPVTESLRMLDVADGKSVAVDRSLYRAVQTPQGFRADLLRRAYGLPYSPMFTDDASVMEAAGFCPLALTEGSHLNIKITHPADLAVAALYLNHLNK